MPDYRAGWERRPGLPAEEPCCDANLRCAPASCQSPGPRSPAGRSQSRGGRGPRTGRGEASAPRGAPLRPELAGDNLLCSLAGRPLQTPKWEGATPPRPRRVEEQRLPKSGQRRGGRPRGRGSGALLPVQMGGPREKRARAGDTSRRLFSPVVGESCRRRQGRPWVTRGREAERPAPPGDASAPALAPPLSDARLPKGRAAGGAGREVGARGRARRGPGEKAACGRGGGAPEPRSGPGTDCQPAAISLCHGSGLLATAASPAAPSSTPPGGARRAAATQKRREAGDRAGARRPGAPREGTRRAGGGAPEGAGLQQDAGRRRGPDTSRKLLEMAPATAPEGAASPARTLAPAGPLSRARPRAPAVGSG